MSEPLFSIVTVTLNCAEDAARTAESVLGQTFGDFEYVVKDGGSTDGTAERLRALGLAVHVAPDTGVYSAMNQALARCAGRYVCFMNAGDLFPSPETLATVARVIRERGEPDFVYGDVRSHTDHPVVLAGEEPDGAREIQYPERLSRFYLYRRMICHQAWFVKRGLYAARGGLDERYRLLADYAFLMSLFPRGGGVRSAHVPAVTAVFQGGGLSERQAALAAEERRAIRRLAFSLAERLLYGGAYYGARALVQGVLYRQIYPRLSPAMRRRLNGS